MEKHPSDKSAKKLSYFRLGLQSLPEMWTHHLAGGLVISATMLLLHFLMRETAGTDEVIEAASAVAAGAGSWDFSIALFLYFLTIVATLIVEFFPHILLSDRILRGEHANPWHEMWESAKALKRFRSPLGIVILIYVSVFLPLVYLGISMLLEVEFHASWEVVDFVSGSLLTRSWYFALVALLAILGFRAIFTVHGMLIDGLSPETAYRVSHQIVHHHHKMVLKELIKASLVFLGILALTYLLLTVLPDYLLEKQGESLPKGIVIEWVKGKSFSALEKKIIWHRILCSLGVLLDAYGSSIITMIALGYFMLRVTRLYIYLTDRMDTAFPERPDKNRLWYRILIIALVFVLIGVVSVAVGLSFNRLYDVTGTSLTDLEIIEHSLGVFFE